METQKETQSFLVIKQGKLEIMAPHCLLQGFHTSVILPLLLSKMQGNVVVNVPLLLRSRPRTEGEFQQCTINS